MAAQAETVICNGAICATWEILRLDENLQKPLVKQGFEHEHQMARKKQPGLPTVRLVIRHIPQRVSYCQSI